MPREKFGQFEPDDDSELTGQRHPHQEDFTDDLTPDQVPISETEFPLDGPLQEIAEEKRLQSEADELISDFERRELEGQEETAYQKLLDDLNNQPPDPMGEIDPLRAKKRKN